MGEVYLAEDTRLNRKVALKFLASEFCADAGFRARFLREAQAAAQLSHPNIITIYEVSEWNDRPFFVMRYISGEPIEATIQSARLSFQEKLRIALQITEGLSVAHQAGILHRDLKPANILLDEKKCPVILDFGLAKLTSESSITSRSLRMGTLAYMSPEQALGKPLDARSDLFSLGSVLYELFSGQKPFPGEHEPAIVYSILHEPPKPLSTFSIDIPDGLQRIIDCALAKELDDRYKNAEELLTDLRLLELGRSPEHAAVGSTTSARRYRSIAALHLRNLGAAADEYLCYGITEDLIVDLTRMGALRVAPMRSILALKGSDDEPEVIAEKLGVELILDGSILKSGNSIRVSAELVDVRSGENLWADRWDESIENLPQIKRALAAEVARSLNLTLDSSDRESQRPTQIDDPRAYEFYLRGRFAFDRKQDESDVAVASGFFRRAVEEEPALLAARCGMAETLIHQGSYDDATSCLSAALEDARRRSARESEPAILRLLAQAYEKQSRWDQALDFAEQARKSSEAVGNLTEEAESLAVIIQVRLRRAELDAALPLYERAMEIGHMLGDQGKVAEALRKMGNVYLRKGDTDQALELYGEAFRIGKKQNDLSLQAYSLTNQGHALYLKGEYETATEHIQRSLQLLKGLGDPLGEAASYSIQAMIYFNQGEYRNAIAGLREALARYSDLGDDGDRALTLNNIAFVQAIIGEYDEAESGLRRALELAEKLNYPLIRTTATRFLGYIAVCRGDYASGAGTLKKALETGQAAGLETENVITLAMLAECHFMLGEFAHAQEFATEGCEVADSVNSKDGGVESLAYLGAARVAAGELAAGLGELERAYEKSQKLRDPRLEVLTLRLLAQALLRSGATSAQKRRGRELALAGQRLADEKEIHRERLWIAKILGE